MPEIDRDRLLSTVERLEIERVLLGQIAPDVGILDLMISAPRSARTWVPKGPAPNWDTVRMRTP